MLEYLFILLCVWFYLCSKFYLKNDLEKKRKEKKMKRRFTCSHPVAEAQHSSAAQPNSSLPERAPHPLSLCWLMTGPHLLSLPIRLTR
jgi:hypothetical protein